MILLRKEYYSKLSEPIKDVTINNLFARAVIEEKTDGRIFVDNEDNPKTFYVLHAYGMSLLFGDYNNKEFNKEFRSYVLNISKSRKEDDWMQVFPDNWNCVIEDLFDDLDLKNIEIHRRVNFKFDKNRYLDNIEKYKNHNLQMQIMPVDREIYENMKGAVIPSHFWNNADDFLNNGIGFSAFYGGELASTAFSAFVNENKLELGIETCENFRGKGAAYNVCSALIDYCLQEGLEPVWACRLSNVSSYNLAERLGFVKSLDVPYYKLGINKQ